MAENDPNAVLVEIRDHLKEIGSRHAEHVAATEQRHTDTQKRMEDIVRSYRKMVSYFSMAVIAVFVAVVGGVVLYLL